MKKIKVAHILNSVGGVDVSVRLILENLSCDKFECLVIHGKNDTKEHYIDQSGNIINDYKTDITREISILNDIKSVFYTYTILKKEKPDVIHAHSAKGGVIGRVVGLFLGINVLVTPQAFSYLSTSNKLKRAIYLLIEKALRTNNSFILASSASERIRAIKDVGYDKEKVLLFSNSINEIDVKVGKIKVTWPDEYICTVGRPTFQKNLQMMVRVMAKVLEKRRIHLIIMGVGHNTEELDIVKKMIVDMNLSEYITLLNWTDRTDVLNIISKSKFYISTARYEGLPYSIIESLALAKPAVVTNCDGNRDLICDGVNGFIVNDNNEALFSERIVQLLENHELQKCMADNAYNSFVEYYKMETNIQKIEKIYSMFSKK